MTAPDQHDHPHHHHGSGPPDHDHLVAFDDPEVATRTELEGEVLVGVVREAAEALVAQAARRQVEVARIVELGCGPGVGSCLLAQRFPAATVVAADGSPAMLARAAARAERLGVADRVTIRPTALPEGIDDLGPADVVFASMVLHHLGDEVGALGRIRRLLRPAGLLGVVEVAGSVRVLPDAVDLGRPGLWDRLDRSWDDWFAGMRSRLPGATPTADPAELLDRAGYEVLTDTLVEVRLDAPLDEAARRFALRQLAGARKVLGPHADPDDLAALDALLATSRAEDAFVHPDAVVRTTRRLLVAAPLVDRAPA